MVIALIVVAIIAIVVVGMYNSLIRKKNQVSNIFATVDAEPLPFVVDGVTRWADVPTVRYEFDTMRWVPEPSAMALLMIGIMATGLGLPVIRRQTTEDSR